MSKLSHNYGQGPGPAYGGLGVWNIFHYTLLQICIFVFMKKLSFDYINQICTPGKVRLENVLACFEK